MDRMCSLQKAQLHELEAIYALLPEGGAKSLRALYQDALQQSKLHVLRAGGSDQIVGAVVLGEAGSANEPPALTLSGVTASPGVPGALHAILDACELIAKLRGKKRLLVACSQQEADAFFGRGFEQAAQAGGCLFLQRDIRQGCSCAG